MFPENAENKPLAEVEVERATAPTRSFPGQAPPPGHPAPPRWPSLLSKLSKLSTIDVIYSIYIIYNNYMPGLPTDWWTSTGP